MYTSKEQVCKPTYSTKLISEFNMMKLLEHWINVFVHFRLPMSSVDVDQTVMVYVNPNME